MNNTLKYITIGIISIILVIIGIIVYRMFFQFNSASIRQYAKEEANNYSSKDDAYCIIMDSVEYILSSHNLTQQVLRIASATKTDKEQELVHAAVAQCRAFSYLAPAA